MATETVTEIVRRNQVRVGSHPELGVVESVAPAIKGGPKYAVIYWPSTGTRTTWEVSRLTVVADVYSPLADKNGKRYTEGEAAALPLSMWTELDIQRVED